MIDGDIKGALQLAKQAVEENIDTNPDIIFGIIRCYIFSGDYKDAKTQLEFLKATHPNIDKTVVCFVYVQV